MMTVINCAMNDTTRQNRPRQDSLEVMTWAEEHHSLQVNDMGWGMKYLQSMDGIGGRFSDGTLAPPGWQERRVTEFAVVQSDLHRSDYLCFRILRDK